MKNRGPGAEPRPSFSPFLGRNGDPRRAGGAPGALRPEVGKSPDYRGREVPSLLYYFSLSPHRDRPDPYTDRKDGIGMAMEEKRLPGEPGGHRITLVARQRLTVSGVNGVERFDEDSIALSTENGRLLVQGEDLHIEKLSLDGGDLLVEGTVDSLTYEEEEPPRGGLLGRLFRG